MWLLRRRIDLGCVFKLGMVGALSFFGVEIPTYPALGAAARPGPYKHTPARRVGVEAPHTYIPRRAAWVWKRRIPTYPPKGG